MEIKEIKEQLKQIPNKSEVKLAIKEGIEEAMSNCDKKYASKDRVGMLEKIVYGFVGMILTAFGGAMIYLVIK
jgi:hypothetical protein